MFDYITAFYAKETADTIEEADQWYDNKRDFRRPPELLPRDEVARSINAEVTAGRGSPHGGVFLDIATRRTADDIRRRLPSMYHQFKELADVDITAEPMEVGPTCHYVMGGVEVDPDTASSRVPGLFAAGEVAGGMHGSNRLGGNSLSDLIVFGQRAGEHRGHRGRRPGVHARQPEVEREQPELDSERDEERDRDEQRGVRVQRGGPLGDRHHLGDVRRLVAVDLDQHLAAQHAGEGVELEIDTRHLRRGFDLLARLAVARGVEERRCDAAVVGGDGGVFFNVAGAAVMLIGRFAMIVPMLAVAGSLATKAPVPASAGTFPTNSGLFVGLLVGVILIVGGLTFFPALSLGPLAEHLAMQAGTTY